ncbi:MAG TPA: patatin-like phospholipase family protein [Thermoanaerobaculia bacterium]|jgi:NTE family protein|nr:patatin-like phospholipase family protein [Thermoanaerobaculia bacterium]
MSRRGAPQPVPAPAAAPAPAPEKALVLSGGGALAAYEIGVMKALFTGRVPGEAGQPLDPGIVCGTSSGAFNGAMLVSRSGLPAGEAIAEMERIWLEGVANAVACRGNGIFRWRGNPLDLLDPRCLIGDPLRFWRERAEDTLFFARQLYQRTLRFARSGDPFEQRFLELFDLASLISIAPFAELLRRVVDPAAIRGSTRSLSIAATNWETGEIQLFGNQDMTDADGGLVIMASGAIPGFFPPVTFRGQPYVDGGLLMNTPLSPAIHAGADLLFVIYLDPDVRNIPLSGLDTSVTTFQRMFAIATAANFNRDIEMAEQINATLAARAARAGARERPYRPLTIHRFHPGDLLGTSLGFLSFERDALAALIERGTSDAMAHDCSAAGCVLPPAVR